MFEDFYIYKRPKLDEFLTSCSQICSIAIWSSADDNYVRGITEQLCSPNIEIDFIWARSECWMKIVKVVDENTKLTIKDYQNIKPLEKLRRKGYSMKNLLIIDDSKYKVIDNPDNYLIIEAFEGKQDDNELEYLLEYLKSATQDSDFRKIEKENWRNKINTNDKN